MAMKRMVVLTTLLAGGAMTAITGCGQQASTTNNSTATSSGPVTINVAIQAAGNSSKALQQAMAAFNKSHPNIHVVGSFYGTQNAYNQALLAKIAGGTPPDVFWVDAPEVSTYVKDHALMPLNSLIKQKNFPISSFESSLVNAFTVNKQIYAVPKDYNVSALFYNKAMFAKANLQPPKTWSQLTADAQKLTTKGVYGFGMYPQINYFYPFVASAGGNFVTESGIKNFNSPAQVKAIQMLQGLFKSKDAITPQMIGASWDGEMFGKQQVAMLYSGSWIPASVQSLNSTMQIGVAPVPVPQAGDKPVSWSYTAGWGISSQSKNASAALQFIKFMESPSELVKGYNQGFDGLPPTTDGMKALESSSPQIASQLKEYEKIVANSVSFGWLSTSFVNNYNNMLQSLVSNPNSNAQTAISQFASSQNLK